MVIVHRDADDLKRNQRVIQGPERRAPSWIKADVMAASNL